MAYRAPATPHTASEMAHIIREQIFRLHRSMPISDHAIAQHKALIEQKRAELRTYEEKAAAGRYLREPRRPKMGRRP